MRFVIIGNGIAGITAARTISATAPDAKVEIYTDDPHPYYWRPRLLELLSGRVSIESMYAYPVEWYAERGIGVHLATELRAIDRSATKVLFGDGKEASYGRLLLAIGSRPFVPPVEGAEKDGFFSLRSMEDALAIKSYAERSLSAGSREAVVVGGGLLGLESANALTSLGMQVMVLEHGPRLLHKQLDREGATMLQQRIERLGIAVAVNAVPEAVLGNDRVSGVRLQGGQVLSGSLVLCSTGVRPNIDLARAAGLAVNRGILVDSQMRTSAEDVYAAGDVAEYEGELPCIIPVAVQQARVAAANMVEPGSAAYHGAVPLTTLKIMGIDLASIGLVAPQEEGYEELRSTDHVKGVYRKLVLRDGRIVGAILLGDKKRVPPVSKLIEQGVDVSAYGDRLLGDDFDLQAIT